MGAGCSTKQEDVISITENIQVTPPPKKKKIIKIISNEKILIHFFRILQGKNGLYSFFMLYKLDIGDIK